MTGALPEHALLLRDFANSIDIDEGTDELSDPAALAAWLHDRGLIPAAAAGPGAHDAGGPGAHDAAGPGAHDAGSQGAGGAGEADLEVAIALRTSLRAAMRAHHQRPDGGTSAPVADPGAAQAGAAQAGAAQAGAAQAGAAQAGAANRAAASRASATRTGLAPATRALAYGLEAAAAGLPLRVTESAGNPALVPVQSGVRGGLAWLAAAMVASTADHSWERLKICAEDSCQWAFLDSSKNRSKHWCSMQECGNRSKTRAYRARRASGTAGQ